MKYKVGDIVRIKSFNWYRENADPTGTVPVYGYFTKRMSYFCGKEAKIIGTIGSLYTLDIDKGSSYWSDEMFENMETKKIILPEGWEIDKVEGNEIILKESENKLPKTWEECYRQLNEGEYIDDNSNVQSFNDMSIVDSSCHNVIPKGSGKPLLAFCQLLVCRDVYRQGWVPNWDDCSHKYLIEIRVDKIVTETSIATPRVLSFQSAEIRDQFLENFKGLIEKAKELL